MSSKKIQKRNEGIDFLRGCACISIILIHTAWWSGQYYLPSWFSNIFLLFDVPIFMFIAGISYNYGGSITKNIKGIIKQWYKWLFFLIFYVLIMLIFFRPEIHRADLINYIFYNVPGAGSLRVVQGSLWWVFMYIGVTIFCSIILYFYNKNKKSFDYNYLLLIMILLSGINIFFGDTYITVYSFFFLLGYKSHKEKIKSRKNFIVIELLLIVSIIIIFKLSGYGITSIQTFKFPPNIFYLLVSMPSIIIVWFLKDRIKKSPSKLISYLGKNAIFFFYVQGISSSILYFIIDIIAINNFYLKFFVMALINIVMAISLGIIINELYNYLLQLLKKKNFKQILFTK